MGYFVKKLIGPRPFKIQFIEYTGDEQKIRDLPRDEWVKHGFSPEMPLEDIRGRARQLNAQIRLKNLETRTTRIHERLAKEKKTLDAYLSPKDVALFESEILFERVGSNDFLARNKIESHWRQAKRIISRTKIDPQDWFELRHRFYDDFAHRQISPAYVKKILRVLNLWGRWHCRKYRRFYEPIPFPRGHEKERIADRYHDKPGASRESLPLEPVALETARSNLATPAYHWLCISLWFGLRPKEVDSLQFKKNYRIEQHEGKQILFVYQTKLTAIAREKRWKYIPCLYPEQEKALEMVQSQMFKRPLPKTVQSRFGERYNLYAGRKAFEHEMTKRGHRLEDISLWLGHQSIERTWKNYKDRQRVVLPRI
jgi:hypothetical protein